MALLPSTPYVIATDVVTLQSRRVDNPLGPRPDQFELVGTAEDGLQEAIKSPFFSRRFCA
jgi:hypothetical protein